jgi:hypothetical protein
MRSLSIGFAGRFICRPLPLQLVAKIHRFFAVPDSGQIFVVLYAS